MANTPEERIDDTPVAEELETSFLSYAMSVIVSRALPDVRDGLKPVHRRILYAMSDMHLGPSTSHVKSARVVGDVIGRFHPHGDSAVYETLVRMAQDFSMGLTLVDGHGNFGTHSDPAAAMRYTECRMSHAAVAMTAELDEDTVTMVPNYDGNFLQPEVLPAAFPNLLVNGTEGIAVGMATKIPPHNLGEAVKACQHLLAHPDATVEDLIKIIPGPDLPTGGLVLDVAGAQEAYRIGRGTFRMRARAEVSGRDIVVTELPYQVGPERVIEAIKKLRDAGRLDEVAAVVDLSDRTSGLRLVITAKRSARGVPVNPEAVLRKLFKYTPLEESFAIHNLALVNGSPQTLTLLQMVDHFVQHRLDVTRRRCEYRKAKAEARAHLLEGFLVALAHIDEVVAVIRSSRDTDSARKKLMKQFILTEIQASAILEMPLRRLTSLEVKKIKDELTELKRTIAELTKYLTDAEAMRTLVSEELGAVSARFAVPRRSTITDLTASDEPPVEDADLAIPDVPVRLALTTTGKLGRFTLDPHKGARTKEDALVAVLDTSVRSLVGAVTNTGRLLHVHPIDVPACEGKARGGKVEEFILLARGERVVALVDVSESAPMLALATANGMVKRLAAKDLPKKSEQELIGLKDGDELVGVVALPAGQEDACELVLVASNAQLLRFPANTVRPQGRSGAGVAGMKLAAGAKVLTLGLLTEGGDAAVVTLSDGSTVKQTPATEFPAKGRAGGGVRCMRLGRGETALAAATVGPLAAVTGVSGSGALVKPPAHAARRDGSGEKTDAVALAWHRP